MSQYPTLIKNGDGNLLDSMLYNTVYSDTEGVVVSVPGGIGASKTITLLNSEVVLPVAGLAGLAIDVRGTFSGTLTLAASINGIDFPSVSSTLFGAANTAAVASYTAPGAWAARIAGAAFVRVRFTAWVSGSALVTLVATNNDALSLFEQPASNPVTLPAGALAIGDVGIQYRANNTGAATIRHVISAASTNATSVKGSAGRVVGYNFVNTTAAFKYVKLHNVAVAPTPGAGVAMTIGIPPNGTVQASHPGGIGFATGIGLTITNLSADADTTAVAAGDVVGDLLFA